MPDSELDREFTTLDFVWLYGIIFIIISILVTSYINLIPVKVSLIFWVIYIIYVLGHAVHYEMLFEQDIFIWSLSSILGIVGTYKLKEINNFSNISDKKIKEEIKNPW
jgi:hypothetical protein